MHWAEICIHGACYWACLHRLLAELSCSNTCFALCFWLALAVNAALLASGERHALLQASSPPPPPPPPPSNHHHCVPFKEFVVVCTSVNALRALRCCLLHDYQSAFLVYHPVCQTTCQLQSKSSRVACCTFAPSTGHAPVPTITTSLWIDCPTSQS